MQRKIIPLTEIKGNHHFRPLKSVGDRELYLYFKSGDPVKRVFVAMKNVISLLFTYEESGSLETLVYKDPNGKPLDQFKGVILMEVAKKIPLPEE
jgi:hypothetical protein